MFAAIEQFWGGSLKQQVIDSGATLVVRPDSGDPADVVEKCAMLLDKTFGSTVNSRGYKVLNHVRILQGDGVNPTSIGEILERVKRAGYSADNFAFGMGGALLQHMNRDTQKFAMKCSAARIDGKWIDVYKDPVTDPGKASKKGRLDLVKDPFTGQLMTQQLSAVSKQTSELVEVYRDGVLLKEWTLEEVRVRSEQHQ